MKTVFSKHAHQRVDRMAAVGLTTTFFLFTSLALPTALAKRGGNGGGGGGYDESADAPAVEEVTPPISYRTTPIVWHDQTAFNAPDFQGINLDDINGLGIAVGFAKLAPAPGESYGERRAGINVMVAETADGYELVVDESGNPIATDTLFDMNLLFENELVILNSTLGGSPWRIAYGRHINDAGQIACQLLPVGAPRIWGSLNTSGQTPTPVLLAIADLYQGTLVAVEPTNDSPDQDYSEFNELGDFLTRDLDTTSGEEFNRLFLLEDGQYEPVEIPSISDYWPSLNSFREITREWTNANGGISLSRFSVSTEEETPLWEREAGGQYGIAEDGSIYAARELTVTTGRGRNQQTTTYNIPYHIEELPDGEIRRTPLITPQVQASFSNITRNPSPAAISGEEEFIITLLPAPATYQLYKPNFGARFPLVDIPAGGAQFIHVGPPAQGGGISEYHGGYIAWFDRNFLDTKAYILTPDGASLPEVVTAP